jgi:phospholipid/cholesterol/gamma-HCH transport system ATP-binding protein
MTAGAEMSDLKIKVRGLKKRFGANVVLDGVDLDVPKGKSLVVIGGSGTGKSVMIKCILGLIEPDAGSIEIDGEEVVGMPAAERERVRRKFGMLFQGSALFDSLKVWENVAFGLVSGRGMKRPAAKEIALRKLSAVGLGPEVAELFPAELSGGMQKRVSLARAIAAEPEIIFFDEPTTGLDPIMAEIGDDAAMIYQGKIIWSGPAEDIDHSNNPYVDQFVRGRAEGPIRMPVRAF